MNHLSSFIVYNSLELVAVDLKAIGNRIRIARKKKGLSQAALAEMIQISVPHMSDIENGKKNIGIEIFIKLTEALQVSADWILQTNVPSVAKIQEKELSFLLSDCTSEEAQELIKILTDIKRMMHR